MLIENELPKTQEHDPRRLLVERIVHSETFAKSERLISFLHCVCDLAVSGNQGSINEQYIGTAVFGRRPDYDPNIDSIVRSHASRLRHRLERYFAEEGAAEDLLLTIPKGGYRPVFEPRHQEHGGASIQQPPAFHISVEHIAANVEEARLPIAAHPAAHFRNSRQSWPLWLATGLMTLIATVAVGRLWVRDHRASFRPESQKLFWSTLFDSRQSTVIVAADSGLVILQNLTKQRISLDTYVSGEYLNDLPGTVYSKQQTLNLAHRRYTSIVDLRIANNILRLPGCNLERTVFRYARDVRPEELKRGNAILLGTYESTPWVQLFEPTMNFYFQNDLTAGVFSIVNRSPRPGEERLYNSINSDPQHTVYGVVAYRPSLSGSGKVLILEGQSMAGTETAADFVFDDAYLLPFLRSIERSDGSIPYFELVLRSMSLSGESSRLETVASRIEDR